MFSARRTLLSVCLLVVAACCLSNTEAFVTTRPSSNSLTKKQQQQQLHAPKSTSALQERKWNFNEGQSPWGLKKNAEIWNGRMAQMAFVVVLLQELVQGKGVVQGIEEGDPFNLAVLGAFAVTLVGLTGWLALKGDDDYVTRDMNK